jgi:hypothetical protein
MVERYEDGAASDQQMDAAAEAADDASESIIHSGSGWSADTLARHAAAWLSAVDFLVHQVAAEVAAFAAKASSASTEAQVQCQHVRDIFGPMPFCPVSLNPAVLTWNDGLVVRLAQAAYEERHLPAGTLDSGRLAVLADALEEAGCTNADILGHLRGPGPHVRGCWPVDLCLGKS